MRNKIKYILLIVIVIFISCENEEEGIFNGLITPTYCGDVDACNFEEENECIYAQENYDCNTNCTVEIDCEGICGGDTYIDECGECGGTGASYICLNEVLVCADSDCLESPDNNLSIYYNNSSISPIAGFQFTVIGAEVLSASGGSAEEAGFTVSTSNLGIVIGFSFSGQTIPPGQDLLLNLEINGDASQACLTNIILSDSNGLSLNPTLDSCTTIVSEIDICTDIECLDYCNANYLYYNGYCDSASCIYDEIWCSNGCDNGQCVTVSDPCESVNCSNYCSGNYLYYDGYCNDGNCNYSNEYCSNGCSGNSCDSDPCEGVNCSNYCSGNYLYYDGYCNDGNCNYSNEYCSNGCSSSGCIENDPCDGVNCSSFCSNGTYYYNGTCTDSGNCNYSTYTCPNGCNWQATECND